MDLQERFESLDGSRPEEVGFEDALASRFPLSAFWLLADGDVFDPTRSEPALGARSHPAALQSSGVDALAQPRSAGAGITSARRASLPYQAKRPQRNVPQAAATKKTAQDASLDAHSRRMRQAESQKILAHWARVDGHGAPEAMVASVWSDMVRCLGGNPALLKRLQHAKPVHIDLVPPGADGVLALGYPPVLVSHASGLFWDHPSWDCAKIALRQDALPETPTLVAHECTHAVHYLAMSKAERAAIYRLLAPTFGSRAAMDEVLAIYAERENAERFSIEEKKAPGIYGFARRQWSADHLLTRFVRKLFFPARALAGPGLGPAGPRGDWRDLLAGKR